MGNEQSQSNRQRQQPMIDFRVLIIGRANAGKTSILQRVCYTTDSPVIYRRIGTGKKKEEVRGQELCNRASLVPFPHRFDLNRPWMSVTLVLSLVRS
jgi:GTPase SAR1 family protein